MNDAEALYQAIISSADDDTPRLVYADWLEENGRQEEAEFIRLDCRLASSGPEDPEHADIRDRLEELSLWLGAHAPWPRAKFAAGLDATPGNDWWLMTHRGFLRMLCMPMPRGRMGPKRIKNLVLAIEDAFKRVPTRWLALSLSAVEDLGDFLKHDVVAALERINIFYSGPEADEAARLVSECPQFSNLRGLFLTFSPGEPGAAALGRSRNFQRLERLTLESENLTAEAIRFLGGSEWFHRLRELDFLWEMPAEGFEELCRLPPCPRLKALILEECYFSVSTWSQFAKSNAFPGLRQLNLMECDLSDGQMEPLCASNTPSLSFLDLSKCSIGNEGIRPLLAARWLESLRWLDLSFNRLEADAVRAIAGCSKLSGLRHLDLEHNVISGVGLAALAESKPLRGLRTLLVGSQPGAKILSSHCKTFLEKLGTPNLRFLSLSELPLGPRSSAVLQDSKFSGLRRLKLDRCKLTDRAVSALLTSPALQNLIDLNLEKNSLKDGIAPLMDPLVIPQLSRCSLGQNDVPAPLIRKLSRARGIEFGKLSRSGS